MNPLAVEIRETFDVSLLSNLSSNFRSAYEALFEQNTVARLRLTGVVLERLQVTQQGKVAFTEIHRGDYEATGAIPQDSEDLINYIRSVAGVSPG